MLYDVGPTAGAPVGADQPEVGAVDWATVATRYGYYDQSHLIRDFRQFAGATPAALLAARAPAG